MGLQGDLVVRWMWACKACRGEAKTKTARIAASRFFDLVGDRGVEPRTNGLRVRIKSYSSVFTGIHKTLLKPHKHWIVENHIIHLC